MASIPLPALSIQPPAQQPNMLENLMRLQQLKQSQAMMPGQLQAQQQSLQAGQLENQQRQQQLKDQQAHTAAMNQWDVKSDPNGETLPQLILKNGGSGDAAMSLKKGILAQKEQISTIAKNDAETGQNNLKTLQGKNDINLGALKTIDDVPDDQLGAHLTQTIQGLTQQGTIDPQHTQSFQQLAQAVQSGQVPPATARAQLKILEKGLQSSSQQMTQAKDAAETAKNTAQAASDTANANKTNLENDFIQKNGGLTQGMADAQYRFLKARQIQGGTLTPEQTAQMGAYEKQKTLVPTATFNMQNAGATGTQGQPSAIAKGIADGSIKWNDAVSARTPMNVKQALLTEVKGINPDFKSSDFDVEKKVQEKYTSGSAADQLTAINTSRNHMATFKTTADALDNGNFKLANQAGNWLNTEFGSDKSTNFNVARSAFAGEVGKAFAGANVGVADRQELIDKINSSSSFAQLKGYADTADELLAGKQKSIKEGFDSGMQGKPNFGNNQPAPAKVLTSSQIQQAAKDHGVSVDEATRQAKAAGYTIQ